MLDLLSKNTEAKKAEIKQLVVNELSIETNTFLSSLSCIVTLPKVLSF